MKIEIITETVVPYKATDITIGDTTVEFTHRPKRKSIHIHVIIGIDALVGAIGTPAKSKKGQVLSEGIVWIRERNQLAELESDEITTGAMNIAVGDEKTLVASPKVFFASELLKVEKAKRKTKKDKKSKKKKSKKTKKNRR